MGQLSGAGGGVLHARTGTDPADPDPQGRGSRPPISPPEPTVAESEPLVYGGDGGQSGIANGFIAVTGSYGVGTSVLYVLDTVHKQLAVYEARGGSGGSRRLVLVGARRIDLDLQLEGYNDESEFSYRDLARRFERRGQTGPSADASAGRAEGGDSGRESGTRERGK